DDEQDPRGQGHPRGPPGIPTRGSAGWPGIILRSTGTIRWNRSGCELSSTSMAVFVLVHGAWGGAHGFRKVRGPLREAGHEVFTPSLTGIGERAHLTSPQVNLTTHVADVVNAVWYEDLSDIVLLGFSYGGFVVTGALGHIGDRVRHLVYLDAFVPGDGDTVAALGGAGAGYGAPELGRDWLVPPLPREFDDPAEAEWTGARRTPHPAACFTEPVRLARPLEDYPFTRTYIKATGEPRPRD